MKKILLFISLLMAVNSEAGLISISTLSNDSQVSYETINTANNTIKNWANGNVESVNIKDGTITIDDMASTASPAQREGDHFNAYTKTGMLPVTDASLTSDISAGTSYVKSDAGLLYRAVTSATSHKYTASTDTWVYIDTNGAFSVTEQVLGTPQPSTPPNSLLLAKVVTSGAAITSVVDYRVTTVSLGISDDRYLEGMDLAWVTSEKLSIDTGVVYVGSTRVSKTSQVQLNITTAGDYIGGASQQGTSKWLYVYVGDEGNIDFYATAPNYHDATGNTAGKKYYYKYGTEYLRCLGAIRLNATGSGEITKFYMIRNFVKYDPGVSVTVALSAATWTSLPCTAAIPPISTLGLFGCYIDHEASTTALYLRPTSGIGQTAYGSGNSIIGYSLAASELLCPTNPSQSIDYYNLAGDSAIAITVDGYYMDIR